jgi:hypothetical protein
LLKESKNSEYQEQIENPDFKNIVGGGLFAWSELIRKGNE